MKSTSEWSGHFSVNSFYNFLIGNGQVRHDQIVWKLKIPIKIKIFAWYLRRGVTLTKDNLAKRNWNGSKNVASV